MQQIMHPEQISSMDCLSPFNGREINSGLKDKSIITSNSLRSIVSLRSMMDNRRPNLPSASDRKMILSQYLGSQRDNSMDLFQLPVQISPQPDTVSQQDKESFGASRQLSIVSNLSNKYSNTPAETPSTARGDDYSTFLHRACQLFPNSPEIIQSALLADQGAIRRFEKLTLVNTGDRRSYIKCKYPVENRKRRVAEPFSLPINIALKHNAGVQVLKMLAEAGTDVLETKDGFDGSVSLGIALRTNPRNLAIFDMLLFTNPKAAMVADRRKNYPLHIACAKGSCIEIVRQLYLIYPEALHEKNFNGSTPLEIAQKNTKCPDSVLDFLTEQAFGSTPEKMSRSRFTQTLFSRAA